MERLCFVSVQVGWIKKKFILFSFDGTLNEISFFIADGGVYQTGSLTSFLRPDGIVHVEAEYTGNELEPVYEMKVMPSGHESGYQRIVCAVRDGKIKIYWVINKFLVQRYKL